MTEARTAEAVNHPAHYQTAAGIEAIDVIEAYGLGRCWHLGDALKYLLRAGRKGRAAEDLRKAEWYVRRWRERVAFKTLAAWPALPEIHGSPRPSPADVVAAFGATGRRAEAIAALLRVPIVAGSGWAVREATVDTAIETVAWAAEEAERAP